MCAGIRVIVFYCVCVGKVKTFAGGLFIIGLVAVGVSVLGCVGAYLENRCLLVVVREGHTAVYVKTILMVVNAFSLMVLKAQQ